MTLNLIKKIESDNVYSKYKCYPNHHDILSLYFAESFNQFLPC